VSGLFLSLRDGARVTRDSSGAVVVRHGPFERRFTDREPVVLDSLEAVGTSGADEDRLTAAITASGGIDALARFFLFLRLLTSSLLLQRTVRQDADPIATLSAISPYFEYSAVPLNPSTAYLLSRFAYIRMRGGGWAIESPLSHARLALHDARALALLHALRRPMRSCDLPGVAPGLDVRTVEQIGTLLLSAGMLTEQTNSGESLEDEDPSLLSWEFHDLLFHSRSRGGRHDEPIGATYRFAGRIDPPPPVRTAIAGMRISLARPAESALREEPTLTSIVESRRSIRSYGSAPLTVDQLGVFLYRSARITNRFTAEIATPAKPLAMEFAPRPYPAGGALYELEIYPLVNACEGLDAGLYHYDPLHHALERCSTPTDRTAALLQGASFATGVPVQQLQVLLVITSRFGRVSWKYSSIAYAATLKHVGVLFQTMYLVATAMKLAPCAIGCGDSDLFTRAAGTQYVEETSVGEFLLGSRGGGGPATTGK
jgi:SagB-type dehydrogenase family enzyme